MENISVDVAGFNSGKCGGVEFSFIMESGEDLPGFMTTDGSKLAAKPTLNQEIGQYTIKVHATYLGETKLMDTFVVTVNEIDTTTSDSSSTKEKV